VSESKIVFYGAGGYAEDNFESLNQKYAPVAFGDNDPRKQGTQFMGLPVLSLGQLEMDYAGCQYYITSDVAKCHIVESLITRGIDPSRIINFEESKKYRSCCHLESQMIINGQFASFCCSDYGRNKSPRVSLRGDVYEEVVRDFFAIRDKTIEELNQPAGSLANNNNPCTGCYNVQNAPWLTHRYIRQLVFTNPSFCNFNCSYCAPFIGAKDYSQIATESLLGLLRFIKENNLINADTATQIVTGEISIHPMRDRILTELWDTRCWVFTNASIYYKKIGEMLSNGRSRVFVSVDAGTRETFAKIKGADLFDRVCENLLRYSQDGLVHLKYIVCHGLNDSPADIEGFIDLCGRMKIAAVDITRDMFDLAPLPERTIDAIAKMLDELQKLGIRASATDNAFAGTPIDQRRIEEKLAELKQTRSGQVRNACHFPN